MRALRRRDRCTIGPALDDGPERIVRLASHQENICAICHGDACGHRDHRRSNAGLYYADRDEFVEALSLLMAEEGHAVDGIDMRAEMGPDASGERHGPVATCSELMSG